MERIKSDFRKSKLLSGAALLTLSTFFVKLVGLLYKIPMLSLLGAEGMGYFNSAYELYILIVGAATAGLPVALSVLLSGALAKGDLPLAKRIDRTALFLCLLLGICGSSTLVLFARRFCELIKSPNAYLSILSIAPTLFFTCLSASFRGYFQGHSNMAPTAISQVAEAFLKLVFGVFFSSLAKSRGCPVEVVAASAGAGLSLGSALTCLWLAVVKRRADKGQREILPSGDTISVLKGLSRLSLPITLGVSLSGAARILDMTMILRRLQSIGMDAATANSIYGSYSTLALSVYGLLPSLVSSVCLPLVPLLSAAHASGDVKREEELVHDGFRLIALFSVPGAVGITAFSKEILTLLFSGQSEAVGVAAPLLSCLGISAFLSCMIGGIQSVLHARKIVVRPLFAMLAGTFLKSVLAYFLIGNPSFAILGAPISTLFCNLLVTLLGMAILAKGKGREPCAKVFFAPLLASLGSVGVFASVFSHIQGSLKGSKALFLCGLFLSVILYFALAFLLGSLKREDFPFYDPKKVKKVQKMAQNKQFFQK